MTITFTAQPMEKPDDLDFLQTLAWNYFDFGRTWQAVITCDDAVIVTDEGCDMSTMSMCFPCPDSFFDWLEEVGKEKLYSSDVSGQRAFLSATVRIPEDMITPAMIDAFEKSAKVLGALHPNKDSASGESFPSTMLPYDELLRLERSGYHTVEVEEKSAGKTGVARSVVRNCAAVEVCYGADDGSEDDVVSPDYFNRRFIITAAVAK